MKTLFLLSIFLIGFGSGIFCLLSYQAYKEYMIKVNKLIETYNLMRDRINSAKERIDYEKNRNRSVQSETLPD